MEKSIIEFVAVIIFFIFFLIVIWLCIKYFSKKAKKPLNENEKKMLYDMSDLFVSISTKNKSEAEYIKEFNANIKVIFDYTKNPEVGVHFGSNQMQDYLVISLSDYTISFLRSLIPIFGDMGNNYADENNKILVIEKARIFHKSLDQLNKNDNLLDYLKHVFEQCSTILDILRILAESLKIKFADDDEKTKIIEKMLQENEKTHEFYKAFIAIQNEKNKMIDELNNVQQQNNITNKDFFARSLLTEYIFYENCFSYLEKFFNELEIINKPINE